MKILKGVSSLSAPATPPPLPARPPGAGRLAYSIKRGPTCVCRRAPTHTHTRAALYGRPPLHCVNTILSLQLDLDYLESTCNAHIRSAPRKTFPRHNGQYVFATAKAGSAEKDYRPKKTVQLRIYLIFFPQLT